MFAGGSVVLIPKATPDALLEAINPHQPTLFPAVPTMPIGLIQHPAIQESHVDRIKSVVFGGAPLAGETMTVFEKLSQTRIMEGYGLSEISNVMTSNPLLTKRKKGSIGVPWPDVDVKVVVYCRERLTAYKVPKIVEFIDEVPLTSVGKPDRKALRKRE